MDYPLPPEDAEDEEDDAEFADEPAISVAFGGMKPQPYDPNTDSVRSGKYGAAPREDARRILAPHAYRMPVAPVVDENGWDATNQAAAQRLGVAPRSIAEAAFSDPRPARSDSPIARHLEREERGALSPVAPAQGIARAAAELEEQPLAPRPVPSIARAAALEAGAGAGDSDDEPVMWWGHSRQAPTEDDSVPLPHRTTRDGVRVRERSLGVAEVGGRQQEIDDKLRAGIGERYAADNRAIRAAEDARPLTPAEAKSLGVEDIWSSTLTVADARRLLERRSIAAAERRKVTEEESLRTKREMAVLEKKDALATAREDGRVQALQRQDEAIVKAYEADLRKYQSSPEFAVATPKQRKERAGEIRRTYEKEQKMLRDRYAIGLGRPSISYQPDKREDGSRYEEFLDGSGGQ